MRVGISVLIQKLIQSCKNVFSTKKPEENVSGDSSVRSTATPSALGVHAIRLIPGQELVSTLQDFVRKNLLQSAFVLSCVGSVTKVTLRMADSKTINTYTGPFEIVSLVGTLSGGGHLHGSFSDSEGKVIGGHLVGDAIIYTTAEVMIGDCTGLSFVRKPCDLSGYDELVVCKKISNN